MKKMQHEEIELLLRNFGWATLCMIDPVGKPYAIEFNYFLDNDDICGLVHPRGNAAACLEKNQHVCVKICDSDAQGNNYRAVSCFGSGYFEKLTDPVAVAWAWDNLEAQLRLKDGKYSVYKKRYLESGRALPLLRIMVDDYSGITNIRTEAGNNKVLIDSK